MISCCSGLFSQQTHPFLSLATGLVFTAAVVSNAEAARPLSYDAWASHITDRLHREQQEQPRPQPAQNFQYTPASASRKRPRRPRFRKKSEKNVGPPRIISAQEALSRLSRNKEKRLRGRRRVSIISIKYLNYLIKYLNN